MPWNNPPALMLLLGAILAACSSQTVPAPPEPAQPTAAPLPTATPPPTPTTVPSPTPLVEPREGRAFTYFGADPAVPIVPRGPAGRWDGKFINPGGMLFHDGQFHMFRNGFSNWPGLVSVGYMTSSAGLAWEEVQADPVFTSDQVPYVGEGEGADVSSVIVLDDGTWVFYFHRVSNNNPAVIGRASAPSPTGPWQVDPEPVLSPGGEGAWDALNVSWPSVLRTADGFAMYYSGQATRFGDTFIGLATSPDGVTWTKYDDPATASAPFAESDPVFAPDELWVTQGVDRARVQLTPEGWVMVYQAGALVKRGLAFSQDGIRWTPHPDNPVLELKDFPFSGTMWDTNLVYHEGTYYYYTEIGSTAATDIYLAIHQGDLKPPDLAEPPPPAGGASLPEGVVVLDLEALVGQEATASPDYTRYLNTDALSLGVYALGTAAVDTQPAHAEDEVYYVVAGEATLDVDGEPLAVGAGSLVYVRARVPHRFEDISADLQVLVFFSKQAFSPGDPAWQAFELDSLLGGLEASPDAPPFLSVDSMEAYLVALPAVEGGVVFPADGREAVLLVLEGQAGVGIGEANLAAGPGTLILIPGGQMAAFDAPQGIRLLAFVPAQ